MGNEIRYGIERGNGISEVEKCTEIAGLTRLLLQMRGINGGEEEPDFCAVWVQHTVTPAVPIRTRK